MKVLETVLGVVVAIAVCIGIPACAVVEIRKLSDM